MGVQLRSLTGGYKNYMTVRPGKDRRPDMPELFKWQGFDGSEVYVSKTDAYNSPMGNAVPYIENELTKKEHDVITVLWGVGNHGGGPSEQDILKIEEFIKQNSEYEISHSTPDAYFNDARKANLNIPTYKESLGTVFTGTYSSQMRIKQNYRKLEEEYFNAEKTLSVAEFNGKIKKGTSLDAPLKDMLFCQFHDILPGSGIKRVEETALNILAHGIEESRRIKTKAMFSLIKDCKKAQKDEYPIFVFNPYPYQVKAVIQTEIQLKDQNWKDESTHFRVYSGSKEMPSQTEKEASNINLDWRKKVTFLAELKPLQVTRFSCYDYEKESAKKYQPRAVVGDFEFSNQFYSAKLDAKSGLVKEVIRNGVKTVVNPIELVVTKDSSDTWITQAHQYDLLQEEIGKFAPLNENEKQFEGISDLPPVRIIEDGMVRTQIETALSYKDSRAIVRYSFYRDLPYFDIELELHWREPCGCVKLSVPTQNAKAYGETVFGIEELPQNKSEVPVHKWVAMQTQNDTVALLNKGSCGVSCTQDRILQTVLRSPAYSAQSLGERPLLPKDRINDRIDNGVRKAEFRIISSSLDALNSLTSLASIFNCNFFAVNAFPGKEKDFSSKVPFTIDNAVINVTAFTYSEKEEGYILRLHNGGKENCKTKVTTQKGEIEISFKPYEIKNYILKEDGVLIKKDNLL